MTLTAADLTPGTVITFTEDLTFLGPRWAQRTPGTHFFVFGLSESGYTFAALNTRTGRPDDIMAEDWVFKALRIIPAMPISDPEE